MEIIAVLVSGFTALGVAFIGANNVKRGKREQIDKEAVDQRAAERMQESLLAMEMNFSTLSLVLATATAVETNHVNGEMRKAKEEAEQCRKRYNTFVNEIVAKRKHGI